MKNLPRHLFQDYERTKKQIKDDPFIANGLISYDDVLRAHYLICDYFIDEGEEIVYGIKDMNILGSALGRQVTGFNGKLKWDQPLQICATLFFGLVKNHSFHDGNKRTALLILIYHLLTFKKTITSKQKEFEVLSVRVAAGTLAMYPRYKYFEDKQDSQILFLSDFLRRNTRNVDKRYYPITYNDFNSLLKNYNYRIEPKPSSNSADVIKKKVKTSIFGTKKDTERRVIQIGFPGWKRQVNPKAVKEVLKAANLTADDSVDSQAFYRGAEPLSALIDEFRGPLKRLKDK